VVEHPRLIVGAWLIAVTLGAVAALGLFGQLTNRGYEVPGSGSALTTEVLANEMPHRDSAELFVLMTVRRPGNDPDAQERVPGTIRRALRREPDLTSVRVISASVAYDEHERVDAPARATVLVSFRLRMDPAASERKVPELRAKLQRASTRKVQMELLGWPALSERYSVIARRDLARTEAIAFPLTLAVLLVAFLSVVAAALPVVLAAATLVVTFALLFLIANGTGLSVFVTNTASVLALGLSIDYSLFMVTRIREELRNGTSVDHAVQRTLETTGRAVVLSGVTLATALLSLLVVGVGLFSSMAVGATLGTLVAVLAAVTLLPAIVCLLGSRLDWMTLRPAAHAARRATLWNAVGRVVVRHPMLAVGASLVALTFMALPAFSLQLGMHTLSALPTDDVVRQATERMERDFSPGSPGPVDIVTRDDPAEVARIAQRDRAVQSIAGPVDGANGWKAMQTTLDAPPDSPAARRIIERIRHRLEGRERPTYVGGPTAVAIDLTDRVSSRTPYVVLITMALAAVMLAFGLRSIVIPIKAVLGTLLSVAATLGIVLRLFPDTAEMQGLEFFVPLFLFVVVFGLSIDYEVFLLSRISEAVRSGRTNEESVVIGLVKSGRSMTLAGLTLAIVFLAVTTSELTSFRQLGAGVAIGIVLDVTIVRCVLIPASVVLLGRWNWWFPRRRPRRLVRMEASR
jgi:uncharacterized membrane protein YdfJ with MMPL/SSD domain